MPATASRTFAGPLVLVALLVLTGCTGPEQPERAPVPTPQASATESTGPVESKHLLGKVVGRLPAAASRRLLDQVTPVVDLWLDEAFTAGSFPREITGAWSGFTTGAARQARAERELTSLAGLSSRIDGVRVTKRAIRYDVLAPGGDPAGVTARITLDLHTSGEVARKVTVRGQLALTPVRKEWKVFAYDLTRGDR